MSKRKSLTLEIEDGSFKIIDVEEIGRIIPSSESLGLKKEKRKNDDNGNS